MARAETPLPILTTKLHRPPLGKDHLHRHRLLDLLENNVRQPLTLVSAPAGYGKSTLLSCWLESRAYPGAWVSLDGIDNDLRVFLSYFLAAVQTQFPDACQHTELLLNSSGLPPLPILTHTLINELDQIGRSFILVLDDYHAINEKPVHDLIAGLLQHPPAPLHLVISSRMDPPLPLASFRARSQITEIRVRDLRFLPEETGTFLEKLVGGTVDNITAAKLEQKTEGWVTGLRLVALSLHQHSDLNRMLADMPTESRYITDYLLAEVLSNLPNEYLEYLPATAILDRFCAPLCDALCMPDTKGWECKLGGEQFVRWLERSNLFVVPLDEQGHWFRYHHLFQRLLQHRLKQRVGPDEITVLQMRACGWFASQNRIDEALKYALAAGDITAATQLIEKNRHAPLNEDKWYILEKWLAQLPDGIVNQRPALLLAKAWVLNFQFSLWAIPPLLDTIETLIGGESKELPKGEIDLFNGIFLFWEGQGKRSMEFLERALKRIPAANFGIRNEAEIYLAGASQIAGQGKLAVRAYRKKFYHEASAGTRKMRLLGALVFIHLLSGELLEADEAVRRLMDMAAKTRNAHISAWASYLRGIIHYQWNNLEKAIHHFSRAVENRYALDAYSDIDSYAGLILSYQAMQQPDKVDQAVDQMIEFAQEANNPDCLPRARSVQARLQLLQGDPASSVRWLETTDFSFDSGTMFLWLEVPRITQCRVLLAMESNPGLDKAAEKLREHLQFNQATHNTPQMIEILLLQARTFQKQGQTGKALAALEHAVTLARPGGYIRPFINLDEQTVELLNRLMQSGKFADYSKQILTAFDAHESFNGREEPSLKSDHQPLVCNQTLENPLSNRELEILAFLGQGFQNKEIAEKLFISPETVKKHASRIYGKLDSHSRQQAVAKAYQLGVLAPDK